MFLPCLFYHKYKGLCIYKQAAYHLHLGPLFLFLNNIEYGLHFSRISMMLSLKAQTCLARFVALCLSEVLKEGLWLLKQILKEPFINPYILIHVWLSIWFCNCYYCLSDVVAIQWMSIQPLPQV